MSIKKNGFTDVFGKYVYDYNFGISRIDLRGGCVVFDDNQGNYNFDNTYMNVDQNFKTLTQEKMIK